MSAKKSGRTLSWSPLYEREITLFLTKAGAAQRSTMGPMLAAAERLRRDSEGKPIVHNSAHWTWNPTGEDVPLEIHETKSGEQGYVPDLSDYDVVGRASRRIREVERRDRKDWRVLEAYFGDRGNRWREAAMDRWARDGALEKKGYGPGAIASLFRFVPDGQRMIHEEAWRGGSHDDVLEIILQEDATSPSKKRKRVAKVRDEAERLLAKACETYVRVAHVIGKPAPSPQREGRVLVARAPEAA